MKYFKYLCVVAACGLLASCDVDEKAIPKPAPSDAVKAAVTMGSDYAWQLYYDLETGEIVSKNKKTDWDLGFETSDTGFHIVLNTGKSMFAYNTHSADFAAMNDTTGKLSKRLWDEASGNLDSTAIGDWRTNHNVYFVDLGYDEAANRLGFKKVQFLNVDATSYEVKIADIDGSNMVQKTILKDAAYNMVFLSFRTSDVVKIEPPKDKWDIVFTQYTHIFYDTEEIMPYLVTGCLTNRYNTTAAKDTVTAFAQIGFSMAESMPLSKAINVIGYDWKTYANNTYTTNTKWNYIIKNRDGFYFKLHFLDFYNITGEKGSPSFEYQKL